MSTFATVILAGLAGGLIGAVLFVISNWIVQELEFEDDIAAEAFGESSDIIELPRAMQLIRAETGWAAAFVLCAGISSALLVSRYGLSLRALCGAIFCFALVSLIFIDRRSLTLPDVITLSTLWLGLGMQLVPGLSTLGVEAALMGCMLAYLIPAVPSFLYEVLRNRRMLGGGDLKMLAMTGAWIGAGGAFVVLFLSALLLVLVESFKGRIREHLHDEHSFGPYIGGVALVYFLASQTWG